MADIPQEAWAAVDAALDALPQPDSRFERDRWRMVSRIALEAAAPALGEHAAQKITAHKYAHEPEGSLIGGRSAEEQRRRTWRRHFGIAARVAATAFMTDEDIRRETAAALNRGDYIACRLPEEEKP